MSDGQSKMWLTGGVGKSRIHGGEKRQGFLEIADGWTLISGTADLDDRIERLAAWSKANGPLLPAEEATVKFMIECQIARHMDDD